MKNMVRKNKSIARIKISVIIPVYNTEKYLQECLDSIMNQTLTEIEIICVNDGSTDSSLSILQKNAEKDSRIKIIDKVNEGQGYTRKIGLAAATGEYILFCDSDDFYTSDTAFEMLHNKIVALDVDIVMFGYFIGNNVFENFADAPVKEIFTHKDVNKKWLFEYCTIWCKIYRRDFFERFDDWHFPKYVCSDDPPLYAQIFLRAKSISCCKALLYTYRTDNLTSVMHSKNMNKRIEEICALFKTIKKIIETECAMERYEKEFLYYIITVIDSYLSKGNYRLKFYRMFQSVLFELKPWIDAVIKNYPIVRYVEYPYLDRDKILFYKIATRFNAELLYEIQTKKSLKQTIKNYNSQVEELQNAVRSQKDIISEQSAAISEQFASIEIIKKSYSYRIGRAITRLLSFPYEQIALFREYNLLKKSKLFDREWYLQEYPDVAKAKKDPIKHYLQFGWKEGRNPSSEFNGAEYLKKRLDVKAAGMCPLVHYEKYGKNEQ